MIEQSWYLLRFLQVIRYLQEDLQLNFLVLKGPVYEELSPGLVIYSRYSDLDIYPLTDKKDFSRKLIDSGRFSPQIDPNQPNFFAIDEVQWLDKQTGLVLDLHNGLFEPYLGTPGKQLDVGLIKHHREIVVERVVFKTLPLEYTLVYLFLHGEKHYWQFQKDRKIALHLHRKLNENNQKAFVELVQKGGLKKMVDRSVQFLVGNTNFANFVIDYLTHLEQANYPKTMFQLWRIKNIRYHLYMSGTLAQFLKRMANGIFPILPDAVIRYPKYGRKKLQLLHFFRLIRLLDDYPQNESWRQLLKSYNY